MGRSPSYIRAKYDDEGFNRGAWSASEDKILSDYIKTHGVGQWKSLARKAGLKRCGKSCRFRWLNYLRSDIKRGNISPEEEELLIRLHRLLGNRWSLIAGRLPGRSDNEIKNYWNTHLRKRGQMGEIEPKFQKPLNEKEVEDKYTCLPQNPSLKTSAARYCGREVDNHDSYNYDHVANTHDSINPAEEELKAADDHVVEIDTSKSWCQLLLEGCTGDFRSDRLELIPGLQAHSINRQSSSLPPSRCEILQEKHSSSYCNLLEQEFLHAGNFNSTYFESLLGLGEQSSL